MVEEEWESHEGPGGKVQWRTADRESINKDMMRLTSDLALVKDPTYKTIVDGYVADEQQFVDMFAYTWNVLMTQGKSDRWSEQRFCEQVSDDNQDDDESVQDSPTTEDQSESMSRAASWCSLSLPLLCVLFLNPR